MTVWSRRLKGNVTMRDPVVNLLEVVGDETINQFDYAIACGRSSDDSSYLLDRI